MWKICLVALTAGAGVVVAFGFVLLGAKIATRAGTEGTHGAGLRLVGLTLSLVCGAFCIGVIAIGVYAMTKKPSSSPNPAKAKAALVIPAGPDATQIASSR